jgi:hypothetical protein
VLPGFNVSPFWSRQTENQVHQEHFMEPERRRAQRLRPSELSYIEFGNEIGGMVWDASEMGLGFQAVAGMQLGRPITLRISPNPVSRIELSGTVVWTDQSKKFGGLQFAELGDDAREKIRAWLASCPATASASQESAAPPLPEKEFPQIPSNEERKTDALPTAVEVVEYPLPVEATSNRTAAPSLTPFNPSTFLGEPLLGESPLSVSRPRRSRNVSIALMIVVILIAPIVLFPSFRAAFGAALIRLGEELKGGTPTQTAGGSSPTVQNPAELSQPAPPQGRLTSPGVSAESPEKPELQTPVQRAPGISNPPQTRDPKKGLHANSFSRLPSSTHRSEAAHELWSKIGAGDVTAEVALAQLYLSGDGVPRSCEQARVLLKAASRSGNTDAAKQLHNLKKRGCR